MSRAAIAVAVLLAASCGSGGDSNDGVEPLELERPATVTGLLVIDVEEGPVGNDDLSEFNVGAIESAEGSVLVQIEADVVRAAGLTRTELVDGIEVRADLATSDLIDPVPSYVVIRLESVAGADG